MDTTALRIKWRAIHHRSSMHVTFTRSSCKLLVCSTTQKKGRANSLFQSSIFEFRNTLENIMTSLTPGLCLPGYASHFGIANIPFGIASSQQHPTPQCVTRFEDTVIFLADISSLQEEEELKNALPPNIFSQPTLNAFAALPRTTHRAVRTHLQTLLKSPGIPDSALEPLSSIRMHLPVRSGDFTDFSCSADHVLNASEAMTGARSHPPSFYHQPVGYAGRCSSLDVSGSAQERPLGQFWAGKPGESEVVFGASRRMDFELEVGVIVGRAVGRRERVGVREAGESVFGFVLVNDWSGELAFSSWRVPDSSLGFLLLLM